MEENQVINEINEETLTNVSEVVSTSKGSVIAKVAVGVVVLAAAGFGAFMMLKKRRQAKHEIVIEPVNEVIDDNDDNEIKE